MNTTEELYEQLVHVWYELDRFYNLCRTGSGGGQWPLNAEGCMGGLCFGSLSAFADEDERRVVASAVLESMALHAMNLTRFFHDYSYAPNADDYVTDRRQWLNDRGRLHPVLDEAWTRFKINMLGSPEERERRKSREYLWKFNEIRDEIERLVAAWMVHFDHERFPKWQDWMNGLKDVRAYVPSAS